MITDAEQLFWIERVLFGAVLFFKLYMIFRMSKGEWPYTIIFCITAIAGWFAFISPAYKDAFVRAALTQTGYFMSIITTVTSILYIVRDKTENEGWIRPTLRNLAFFMLCAMAILFVLFKVAPIGRFRTDAQLDSLTKQVKQNDKKTEVRMSRNNRATRKVEIKTDTLITELRKVKALLKKVEPATREIEGLRRDLRATRRSAKKTEQAVIVVQQNQEATQEKVEAVVAKTDSVKAVVASVVILPDTTRSDSSKAIVRTAKDSVAPVKRGLWKRLFRKE